MVIDRHYDIITNKRKKKNIKKAPKIVLLSVSRKLFERF